LPVNWRRLCVSLNKLRRCTPVACAPLLKSVQVVS
jgi:hypothetical protein